MSASAIRTLARKAAALLPQSARRRLADYRFGYTQDGRHFDFHEVEGTDGPVVTIDRGITIRATPAFMSDLRFHFVANGQSRDEIGAFLDVAPSLPEDALLYDVGAHRGLFSLVHCGLASARRAILFEPSASLATDARALLALNGFDTRATVRLCGVSDRGGTRRIFEDALGFARIASEAEPAAATVEFTTLDEEYRRNRSTPAIVKIDVEGAEAEVIRGAAELLREVRPVLFLELHMDILEQRGESVGALLTQLAAWGYRFTEPNGRARSPRSLESSLRAIVRVVGRGN